ncbi:RHS repeat-associated core domain-containing protein, partial [Streptomyces sp. NPDC048417]|uniref:RHS repeat-associated core domain-containing protein n=1 Tax=Streptomyces sp. NPDC048417 TaxID=3155387 RepID=UPI00342BD69B
GITLMGARLYNPTTGRFLSIDPIPGGNANAYEYVTADPLDKFDLDGRRWCWRWCSTADRWGRNPNWRHYYWGANIATSVVSFRRIKALKKFRARSCWTRWRGFASCGGHALGIADLIYSVHQYSRNYRYLRAYNQALTYSSRQRICRQYTHYRGRGQCA